MLSELAIMRPPTRSLIRYIAAAALVASAAGCAIVPAEPGYYYRSAPTVIETYPYPAYRYGPPPAVYYEQRYYDDRRHGDDGDRHRHRDQSFERRLVSPPNPVGDALRLRRDVHRKLGFPF